MPKTLTNNFSILAGEYRRKKLRFDGDSTLRPTPSRVRETLFNWLRFDLHDARVLDCFAGSGALGFEAYSRGAKSVTFVEKNPLTIATLQHNIGLFGSSAKRELHLLAGNLLYTPLQGVYDIVFIDPPFHREMIPTTLTYIMPYTTADSYIYIESEYRVNIPPLTILKEKKAAGVYYSLNHFK